MPDSVITRIFTCFYRTLVSSLIMLSVLVQSCGDASAQSFEFAGKRKKEVLRFKMIRNLMIIELSVNGKGPFNFVLDTGVGLFLISDPALIDSVSIENLRTISITGFGEGDNLTAYVTPSLEVSFGNLLASNLPAAILKEDVFELSNYVGMPVHGLIGYDFFNSFIVKINFTLSTLTLYRPYSHRIRRKGQLIPLIIEDRKPYFISNLLLESGREISAKLIIDTGAGHPLSLETFEGVPFELPEKNIAGNLGIGLSGAISGHLGRIRSLKLGRYTLNNVVTAFPDYADVGSKVYALNRNGNMGISILKRFKVIFDYKRSAMYIRPGSFLKEPFEHDMSGMELTSAGDDFERILVSRVEAGSPADELGLSKNDEILAINFKPVRDMNATEIDNIFRSKAGRSLVLDVLPHGKTNLKDKERVIITLKRRI